MLTKLPEIFNTSCQLFIPEASKEDNVVTIYTRIPSNETKFSEKDFSLSTDTNFSDLIYFLNCDLTAIHPLLHALTSKQTTDDDFVKSVNGLKDFLCSHSFWKTNYVEFIYDAIFTTYIYRARLSCVSSKDATQGLLKILKRLQSIFPTFIDEAQLQLVTSYYVDMYHKLPENPCPMLHNTITSLQNFQAFIRKNIPQSQYYSNAEKRWITFLHQLTNEYGNPSSPSPYSLTHHVIYKHLDHKHFATDAIKALFKDNLTEEITNQVAKQINSTKYTSPRHKATDSTPHRLHYLNAFRYSWLEDFLSFETDGTDAKASQLLKDFVSFAELPASDDTIYWLYESSRPECRFTFQISTFFEYTIAEIKALMQNKLSLKYDINTKWYLCQTYNNEIDVTSLNTLYTKKLKHEIRTYNEQNKRHKFGETEKDKYTTALNIFKEIHMKIYDFVIKLNYSVAEYNEILLDNYYCLKHIVSRLSQYDAMDKLSKNIKLELIDDLCIQHLVANTSITNWKESRLEEHFLVLYISKICFPNTYDAYAIYGLTDSGDKKFIDLFVFDNLESENWTHIFQNLYNRGLQNVSIFSADYSYTLIEAFTDVFPKAKYIMHLWEFSFRIAEPSFVHPKSLYTTLKHCISLEDAQVALEKLDKYSASFLFTCLEEYWTCIAPIHNFTSTTKNAILLDGINAKIPQYTNTKNWLEIPDKNTFFKHCYIALNTVFTTTTTDKKKINFIREEISKFCLESN